MACRYVLPNTSEMNRGGRGSLLARLALAAATGCELIEVPADFVKNRTEIGLTGLALGDMLDRRAISILYRSELVPASCQAVFHTEPEINVPSILRWHDQDWVQRFVAMQLALAEHLGIVPAAVEIHPGSPPNEIAQILAGARALMDAFAAKHGRVPLILLENRTRQVVSDGRDLLDVWRAAETMGGQFGIVLDVQQLFTQTKPVARFLQQLALIPDEALRAFHIHCKHRVPTMADPIPWAKVSEGMRGLKRDVIVNPEIHHRNGIAAAKAFCCALWAPGGEGAA